LVVLTLYLVLAKGRTTLAKGDKAAPSTINVPTGSAPESPIILGLKLY